MRNQILIKLKSLKGAEQLPEANIVMVIIFETSCSLSAGQAQSGWAAHALQALPQAKGGGRRGGCA